MNPSESPEPLTSFDSLVTEALSRRDFVRMGLGSLAVSFFAAESSAQDVQAPLFTFESVPVSSCDEVKVPKNYQPKVLYAWGDPVNGESPAFKPDGNNTTAEQEQQAGMGHDGMQWFPWPGGEKDGSERGLLVMNHEYTDPGLLFPDGLETMSDDKIRKSQAAHGVSVIAVKKNENGEWKVVPSEWSRRITANTPMTFTGPAAGCDLLKTKAYQDGMTVLGTFNNCASGKTPWGTYLTCEENVHGYFGSKDPNFKPTPDQKRYGFKREGESFKVKYKEGDQEKEREVSRYQWWMEEGSRFDLNKHPNEPHRFGYVVEIDPQNPKPDPRKHTALGRFRHENAAVTLSKENRAVVYMGDDAKNEYIYKFVSKGVYDPDPAKREANMKLLESGTLYVAKFENGGKGTWIPLVAGEGELRDFKQHEISVRTRQAADKVRATSMDRPEWIAVQPGTGKVFVTLTNNSNRGGEPPSSNSPDGTTEDEKAKPPVNDANPRTGNPFGHIISWDETGGDAAAVTFHWSIFILAGDRDTEQQVGDQPKVNINGDPFGSPDGLTFDDRGILWIQTDVSSSKIGKGVYEKLGNNMMLAANPATGMVRRFLTGPRGCEITGLAFTPDLKTMFVNIQHPGEPPEEGHPSNHKNPKAVSTWPDGLSGGRPRPATVVVTHRTGEKIGA